MRSVVVPGRKSSEIAGFLGRSVLRVFTYDVCSLLREFFKAFSRLFQVFAVSLQVGESQSLFEISNILKKPFLENSGYHPISKICPEGKEACSRSSFKSSVISEIFELLKLEISSKMIFPPRLVISSVFNGYISWFYFQICGCALEQ